MDRLHDAQDPLAINSASTPRTSTTDAAFADEWPPGGRRPRGHPRSSGHVGRSEQPGSSSAGLLGLREQ
ncbi:hypothetical protein ACTMTI_54310 [Nonomuraea sp. H19]|uniref:hypothetical protein n=1 Tax=Nonomuraea sp. H19 TaxID=3452206 RepID=UPI003F89D790